MGAELSSPARKGGKVGIDEGLGATILSVWGRMRPDPDFSQGGPR